MPDDYAGEVSMLFVVSHADATLSPDDLSRHVGERIAEPPARPKQVFVLDEFPLTSFAKIARFHLRQLAVEHRVRHALGEAVKGLSVLCDDPAAKRVRVTAQCPLTSEERARIEGILARFELFMEG